MRVIGALPGRKCSTMAEHRSTELHSSASPFRIRVGALDVRAGDAAGWVVGDRSTKPLGEVLRCQIPIGRVKRGITALRLSEHGHPRRIDIF